MAKPYSVHCRKVCDSYLKIMVIPFICLEGKEKSKSRAIILCL